MRFRDWGLLLVLLLSGCAGGLLLSALLSGCAPVPRRAAVLYLSPLDAPELWKLDPQNGPARQLTHSGGSIYDFAAWPDGSKIVFSQKNALGGLDLRRVGRDGGQPRLLLDCGGDRCAGAAVAPDGKRIAYARRNASENPGGEPGLPHLWWIDPVSGRTAALYADGRVACEGPSWSPDGLRLACYDPLAQAIRVHLATSEESSQDLLFPTPLPHSGSWERGGTELLFVGVDLTAEAPLARLSRANIQTGEIATLSIDLAALDFSPPVVSPDGQWLALGALENGAGPGRDLWLVDLNGSNPLGMAALEENARYATTACRWSPDAVYLACQQLALGSADSRPAIVLWNVKQRTPSLLAENAALPAWLP
jgi:Tol biopolymer transport system component